MRQRVVDHVGCTPQASVEQFDGAVASGGLVAAQPVHRRARRGQRVAQLVGDETEMFGRLSFQFLIAAFHVLGERVRDPRVQPLQNHLLFLQGDLQAAVPGELEDALVQQTVLADHLGDVKVQPEALRAVLAGVRARGRQRRRIRIERRDDLVDERRDVIEQAPRSSVAP